MNKSGVWAERYDKVDALFLEISDRSYSYVYEVKSRNLGYSGIFFEDYEEAVAFACSLNDIWDEYHAHVWSCKVRKRTN